MQARYAGFFYLGLLSANGPASQPLDKKHDPVIVQAPLISGALYLDVHLQGTRVHLPLGPRRIARASAGAVFFAAALVGGTAFRVRAETGFPETRAAIVSTSRAAK